MSSAWRKWLVYMPAVILAAGIAVLSLIENPYGITPLAAKDKLLHGLAYLLLSLSLIAAMEDHHSSLLLHAVSAFVIAVCYGALIECLQRFCTLTRTGEMADLFADMAGALIGIALYLIYRLVRR